MANKTNRLYYNEITILKAIATFLITWFHFKWTVPEQYANFFIGGAIGNSLFFYCSGYLLKFREEKFVGEWLVRKYLRIMPSVYCFYVIIIFTDWITNTPSNLHCYNFFYPTTYWFVNAILFFFLLIYLLKCYLFNINKELSKRNLMIVAIIIISLHTLYYFLFVEQKSRISMDDNGFKCWFFFFLYFLWGIYDKSNIKEIKGSIISCVKVILAIVLFFVYKKLASYYGWLAELQFIVIPLLLAFIIQKFKEFSSFIFSLNFTQAAQNIISFLSNLTLDIYIVQVFLINLFMPKIEFPFNILIVLGVIVLFAYINKRIANYISKYLNNKI